MRRKNGTTRRPIDIDDEVLVSRAPGLTGHPARVLRRLEGSGGVFFHVVYTNDSVPGAELNTDVVGESDVFQHDEIDKYEPEEHRTHANAFSIRLTRSLRRLLRNSTGGLGVNEIVGGEAADLLHNSGPSINIGWRAGQYPTFRLVVAYTMREEISRYLADKFVTKAAYAPASSVRLIVSNLPFADPEAVRNSGIVSMVWQSRRDDEALAKAIRAAVAQRQSAAAA